MKLSVNVIIQMLALAAQGINATQDLLPAKSKFWAMVALSAVQGVTAVLAHFSNSRRYVCSGALHQQVARIPFPR